MMGKTLQKSISVLIILCIALNPMAFVVAQEVTPSETPPVEQIVSPTPTVDITPTPEEGVLIEEVQSTHNDASTSGMLVGPQGASVINSGDDVTLITGATDNTSIAVTNNNDITVNRDTEAENISGNNVANENINTGGGETTIKTGEASTLQNVLTVINTNILGSAADALLINVFDPSYQPIDLSQTSSCNAQKMLNTTDNLTVVNTGSNVKVIDDKTMNESTRVDNTNNATINNTVNLTSDSGNNEAIDNIASGTHVETGDATVNLNMLNVANTNLVGNCFFYGVINLFGSQTGDILLPYEYGYVDNPSSGSFVFNRNQDIVNTGDDLNASASSTINQNTKINNNNYADVSTVVNTNANTGGNSITDGVSFDSGPSITTGNATSWVNILDILNTNIVGNKFFALKINTFGHWVGTIRGFLGNILVMPDYVLLYNGNFPIPTPEPPVDSQASVLNTGDNATIDESAISNNSLAVNNNNTATVRNIIDLTANTGDNAAGKFNAHITTGNASIYANILNMINTNIVGDNWFYAVVNIFNNFVGDIVFPRPDLSITTQSSQNRVQDGGEITFFNHVVNQGNYTAQNVTVSDTLPTNAQFIRASDGGSILGNVVTWNVGELLKNQARDFTVTVRYGNNSQNGQQFQNTCQTATDTAEANLTNNNASFGFYFYVPQASSNNNSGGNGGSSNGGGSSSNNNNSPVFQNNNFGLVPFVTYVNKSYRVYNKKTKKWETRWRKVKQIVYRKPIVKKPLAKKPIIKKIVKSVKKLQKTLKPLKITNNKPKLQTFINYYSSLFGLSRKTS